ncbi:MAG: hypothetical protein HQK62_07335 [Desulfamplus sp.]|nr:hypothetical protein [Desulfamplus sp.]
MIIKSNPKKNFTCIPNEIFTDCRLSRKARFLLLELLSKPAIWNINYKHLINSGKEGEYSVRGGIQELIETGYIHRETTRKNGKISGFEYYVYDRPMTRDEHKAFVSVNPVEEMTNITPPDQYPNRQIELPFQGENSRDIVVDYGKTNTRKTCIQETAPIINTDNNQILRGVTTTTPESDPKPETLSPPLGLPSSYPAIADKNNLIDLIPPHFRTAMVEKVINKALLEHTRQEVEEAIKYASVNVKGGDWQFKAYLDKTLRNGWAEGYLESMEVPKTGVIAFPFPARYSNGTMSGSARMDSNYQAAADFLREMEVQP